jgi:hypothetical protein
MAEQESETKEHLKRMHEIFLEALRHREQEFLQFAVIIASAIGLLLYATVDKDKEFQKDGGTYARLVVTQPTLPVTPSVTLPAQPRPSTQTTQPQMPSVNVHVINALPQMLEIRLEPAPPPGHGAEKKSFTSQSIIAFFAMLALFLGVCYSMVLGYNFRYITLALAKIEAILELDDCVPIGWPRKPGRFIDKSRKYRLPFLLPPEIIKFFGLASFTGLLLVGVGWTVVQGYDALITIGTAILAVVSLSVPMIFGWKFIRLCEAEPQWPNESDEEFKTRRHP